MLPTFQLGPWQVSTYAAVFVVGVPLFGAHAFYRLLQLDHPSSVIVRGVLLTIAGGIGGAYLITYLINAWRMAHSGFLVNMEGTSIVWALVCGLGVAAAYCWRHQASLGRALDLITPTMALGLAVGRLACFAAGCCYGRPTDSWLGFYLPNDTGVWAVRYPTQLLSAAVNLSIFVTVLAVERYGQRQGGRGETWPFNGFLTLLALGLYCLKRFCIAFLRQSGAVPMLGLFSWMHLNALAGLAAVLVLLAWNLAKSKGGMKR
jgi:phosphatidylglycerol:prolipoprotein diacylglycerol transferase